MRSRTRRTLRSIMSITEQMEQSSSWLSDFKIFAGSTTAHGVNQIFVGRNKFVRLLFLLAWIVCVLYSLYMIMTSILSFIDKPTGTKYEVITNDYSSTAPQVCQSPRSRIFNIGGFVKQVIVTIFSNLIRKMNESSNGNGCPKSR